MAGKSAEEDWSRDGTHVDLKNTNAGQQQRSWVQRGCCVIHIHAQCNRHHSTARLGLYRFWCSPRLLQPSPIDGENGLFRVRSGPDVLSALPRTPAQPQQARSRLAPRMQTHQRTGYCCCCWCCCNQQHPHPTTAQVSALELELVPRRAPLVFGEDCWRGPGPAAGWWWAWSPQLGRRLLPRSL